MENVWKATIRLNECYRTAGSQSKAEEMCKEHHDNLHNMLLSDEFELTNILKYKWIDYNSNFILNVGTKKYYAPN